MLVNKISALKSFRMVSVALYFVADSIDELAGWNVPDDLMFGPATYRKLARNSGFFYF